MYHNHTHAQYTLFIKALLLNLEAKYLWTWMIKYKDKFKEAFYVYITKQEYT